MNTFPPNISFEFEINRIKLKKIFEKIWEYETLLHDPIIKKVNDLNYIIKIELTQGVYNELKNLYDHMTLQVRVMMEYVQKEQYISASQGEFLRKNLMRFNFTCGQFNEAPT